MRVQKASNLLIALLNLEIAQQMLGAQNQRINRGYNSKITVVGNSLECETFLKKNEVADNNFLSFVFNKALPEVS